MYFASGTRLEAQSLKRACACSWSACARSCALTRCGLHQQQARELDACNGYGNGYGSDEPAVQANRESSDLSIATPSLSMSVRSLPNGSQKCRYTSHMDSSCIPICTSTVFDRLIG